MVLREKNASVEILFIVSFVFSVTIFFGGRGPGGWGAGDTFVIWIEPKTQRP